MIPTAVTVAETAELQRLARGKVVLEVGALLGYSTVALASAAQVVHSVDPHEAYPQHAPRPTLGPFVDNVKDAGVWHRVVPHIGYDYEVLPLFAPRSFDLAFLDLTGLYDDTLECIRRTVPLLRHHAALCVHDCGHPEWPGALDAVETFARGQGTTYHLVDRLAVFEQTWPSAGDGAGHGGGPAAH